MTIKEAEERTGLARANIRYYEDQGFFSAARGENGYRDYSEENIDILLKVKLLRQLGFSLEEIHELQNGERSLEPALERREADLEREQRELGQAVRLCRDMRSDGVSFYTLDARRYLYRLEREEEILSQDRDPVRIFPWRRYFARSLDYQLCVTLLVLILQLTARVNVVRLDRDGGSSFLLMLATLVILAGAETLAVHFWGTTPGKALLGLKILREDGSRLSLEQAARRTGMAIAFYGGSWFLMNTDYLPFMLAGLGMQFWAYWRVCHENPMFWEEGQLYLEGSTREQAFWAIGWNFFRVVGYAAVSAVCVGLMLGGHLLASMPPHRGADITVEQFVDNYNRYMEFSHGKKNISWYLTEEGVFEQIDRGNHVIIYALGEPPVPQTAFRFTEEDGRLTQVALTRSYDSGGPIAEGQIYGVDIPYEEIAVAARSFLGKPLGLNGTAKLYQELVEQKGNVHRCMKSAQFDSEMGFSGYHLIGDDLLIANAGERQSYLVECSMRRDG